jgi:hypothetical protein
METMESLTQVERHRLTTYIGETHNRVLEAVRDFSDEQLDFKPGPDRWSISENVEHLTIIHNLVLKHVQMVIGSPSHVKESAWQGRDEELLDHIRSRGNPLKVPEIGNPTNQWPHAELFHQFEDIRDRIMEFGSRTEAPLRSFCFPHPVYGEKDCYQWLLGTGAHCERHLAQIQEVIASPGFPER